MFEFEKLQEMGHEEVVICNQPEIGLKAIIAIHSTALGPALGGCRMWNYENTEAALEDVLRLSRGMTYKAAVAGLNLGGGKAVIIGDSKSEKTEALFRAFGRYVESLSGRYITAEDVGTTVQDMEHVYRETSYVTGVLPVHGGSGDPSPLTAYGVRQGMRACVKEKLGKDSLRGLRIALQGLGNVGGNLVKYLVEDGCDVIATDMNLERRDALAKELGFKAVDPDQILNTDCDILSPNALGGVMNDETIANLKTQIVCGGANNQLVEPRHGDMLRDKDILYAPDYVINAGGLINVSLEMEGYNKERAYRLTGEIYNTMMSLFAIAKEEGLSTYRAADRFAEKRIAALKSVQSGRFFLQRENRWQMRGRSL
jgi:leucine dehydrogenase